MRFWHEIRRRKMFQVAATYAVVAWLLAQVVAVVNQPLHLPDWFDTAVIVSLGIGFPVTLLLSWAFNLTRDGWIRDTGSTPSERRPRRTIEAALLGLIAVAVVWLLYRDFSGRPPGAAVAPVAPRVADAAATPDAAPALPGRLPNSVAVLPFDNLSPDADDAFFAAGLHDEILSQLAKVSALNVIARASVLAYPGSGKSIPQIANELNVETVMEGSIRYSRDRVRVTAQLIDAATGVHLWSETYDREFDDIFTIESDIATNVVDALRAEFSLEERATLERRPTASPEAYALYLEARNLYGVDASAERTERLLIQALDIDPEFALAYGLLAERYAIGLSDASSGDAIAPGGRAARERIVRDYAGRALELDPASTDAHSALGVLDLIHWRWTSSRERFDAAARLGSLRDWSADLHSYTGEHEQAVGIARRLAQLSPNDWAAHRNLAQTLLRAGDLAAADESLRRSLELSPARSATHRLLAQLELARNDRAQALREARLSEQLLGDARTRLAVAQLAWLYGRLGQDSDAERLYGELAASGDADDIGAGNWAMAHLAIGDVERAAQWLVTAAGKAGRHEPDQGFLNLMLLRSSAVTDPALQRPELAAALDAIRGD